VLRGPKALNKPAQGDALGPARNKHGALKGRHKSVVTPFQG